MVAEGAVAGEVKVAVASNFTVTAERLAAAFTARTGDEAVLSFGASGALYTQIAQGAPFEVLLSADGARPRMAIENGFAVGGTRQTYAIGALVLYAPGLDLTSGFGVLKADAFAHLAVADPTTSPYGAAADFALAALGLKGPLADRLVVGENIGQTLQFIESGNAELGFVALAQVMDQDKAHVWVVPRSLYRPIAQDAVLLNPGADNAVAKAFLDFLKSDEARTIIGASGYELP
jgi:molybdate transport system substrate-binding protein